MTIADRAHQVLAVISAIVLAVSGGATVIAGVILAFGGHVTAVDITGKTALASGALLVLSKLIDSVNDAWRNAGTTPNPPAGG
jgi:hypothetical protein